MGVLITMASLAFYSSPMTLINLIIFLTDDLESQLIFSDSNIMWHKSVTLEDQYGLFPSYPHASAPKGFPTCANSFLFLRRFCF